MHPTQKTAPCIEGPSFLGAIFRTPLYFFCDCSSGAQGEYAGLMVIKAYLKKIGQKHRNVSNIPITTGRRESDIRVDSEALYTLKVVGFLTSPDGG